MRDILTLLLRRNYQVQRLPITAGTFWSCNLQHHNDTIIKTQEDFFIKNIYTSHFICKGSKRVTQGLRVRGSWRPNINCNILTPTLMAASVVSFLFS